MPATQTYRPEFEAATAAYLKSVLAGLKRSGCTLAEARLTRKIRERIQARDGALEDPSRETTHGFGIRVLKNGAWGYAAAADFLPDTMARVAASAVALANTCAPLNAAPVVLKPRLPATGAYGTLFVEDPFAVPLASKLDLVLQCSAAMMGEGIVSAEASVAWQKWDKLYLSSEGDEIAQGVIYTGGGIVATAAAGSVVQRRSYPMDYGAFNQAGYEYVREMDLPGHAEAVRDEALALLTAPDCPEGFRTLIVAGPQMALQIHESCGHAVELDRALGMEVSLAGASFLTIDKLGRFQYGAPIVNLTADSTLPRGLGTFGFDDEGTPAGRQALVKDGLFTGYLSSRETAAATGAPLHGAMRAQDFSFFPIVRMTNVNLEPGNAGSLDDLIADTDDGILVDTNRTWSIDDVRLNFQFGCETAWEIKHGKRTRLLRNALYTDLTPRFWNSCDAICGPEAWVMYGVPHCGKGDPMQMMQVGHGAAPARFRGVKIGARR